MMAICVLLGDFDESQVSHFSTRNHTRPSLSFYLGRRKTKIDFRFSRRKRRDLLEIFFGRTVGYSAIRRRSDQGAAVGVPGVAARSPRKVRGERGEEVVNGPADDGVVVHAHVQVDDADCIAHTCRTDMPARGRGVVT